MSRPSKEVKDAPRGVLRQYKTYNFIDKDPVIDLLHTAKDDRGDKLKALAEDSGVSIGTLGNWFRGKTRRPQFATVVAVARSLHAESRVATLIRNGGVNGKQAK